MKLNKEKFMKTEMGGELEETIRTWDKAIDERRKATPGIGNPDQGTRLQILGQHLQKLSGQMGSVQTGDQAVLWN